MQGAAWGVSKGFPIRDIPSGFGFIGQGSIGPMPVATIAFIVVAIIAYLVLHHTTFGRSMGAIRAVPGYQALM